MVDQNQSSDGQKRLKVGLTDAKIKGLIKPLHGQMEYADQTVPGLRLRVGASGQKTFILRKRVGGQPRNITIGRFGPRCELLDARRKARQMIAEMDAAMPTPTVVHALDASHSQFFLATRCPGEVVAKDRRRLAERVSAVRSGSQRCLRRRPANKARKARSHQIGQGPYHPGPLSAKVRAAHRPSDHQRYSRFRGRG